MNIYLLIGVLWTLFAWWQQWGRIVEMELWEEWCFIMLNIALWPFALGKAAWRECRRRN